MNRNPSEKSDKEIYFPFFPGSVSAIAGLEGVAGEAAGVPQMDESLGRHAGTPKTASLSSHPPPPSPLFPGAR